MARRVLRYGLFDPSSEFRPDGDYVPSKRAHILIGDILEERGKRGKIWWYPVFQLKITFKVGVDECLYLYTFSLKFCPRREFTTHLLLRQVAVIFGQQTFEVVEDVPGFPKHAHIHKGLRIGEDSRGLHHVQ